MEEKERQQSAKKFYKYGILYHNCSAFTNSWQKRFSFNLVWVKLNLVQAGKVLDTG